MKKVNCLILGFLLGILITVCIEMFLIKTTGIGFSEKLLLILSQPKASQQGACKTPTDKDVSTKKTLEVLISKNRFIHLFKEICPELLSERGMSLSDVYKAILAQFSSQATIDEEFVRELLEQMKVRAVVFDGKSFYGFQYKNLAQPSIPMDIDELKKDTISIKYYLENVDWYSTDIFRKLTKQNKVKFALRISDEGYLFEAMQTMKSDEFFAICSDGNMKYVANRFIYRGDSFWIPRKNLRRISRIGEFQRKWKDHLGTMRRANVILDLDHHVSVYEKIYRLKDGTIVKNENGDLLSIDEDKTLVRRVDGSYKKTVLGWKYIEDGKVVFEVKNNEAIKTKWGKVFEIEGWQVIEDQKGREILEIVINKNQVLFRSHGELYRVVADNTVTDSNGRIVNDQSDIAYQWLIRGKFSYVTPNFDAYVSSDPFIRRLSKNICTWYNNDDDRKNGILSFIQSLEYSIMLISGQAKTPKDSFLSDQADCADASIFAISLFASAGFDSGYVVMSNRIKGESGHAVPVVEFSFGKGIKCFGKIYAFAEATARGKIGDERNYSKYSLSFFHRHGGSPLKF